ncbi:MAG: type IV secretion system DNA-binding domain-containing protein [Candidatus Pacebacteria bacterium]|nr:type IV secretion system DNA-binding domain-containing protein [Candidatus Paceibacterota bacterium]
MNEGVPQKFSSPEEEITFLRQQIAKKEQEVLGRSAGVDESDAETIVRQQINEYVSFTPKTILEPAYELDGNELKHSAKSVEFSHDPVEEVMQIVFDKGIKNALTVLDKVNNAYVIDEVHKRIVEHVHKGAELADFKKGVPPWHLLHMTLYEVTLPANKDADRKEYQLSELVGTMEQLLSGLRTIGSAREGNHFVIEIAVANNSHDIVIYVAVPDDFKSLFEKQTLSLFPHAVLTEQPHDYNIYIDGGHTLVADLVLQKHPIYPLRTHEEFATDPLEVVLNAFSKIGGADSGAALQFVVRHPNKNYRKNYQDIIEAVEDGQSAREAIKRSTTMGDLFFSVGDFVKNDLLGSKKSVDKEEESKEIDNEAIELFKKKLESNILEVNIRLVVSAKDQSQAESVLSEIEASFHQFDNNDGNKVGFKLQQGLHLRHAQEAFSFRKLSTKTLLPLSATELATLVHFPGDGVSSAPQFKQSYANSAPAPTNLPTEGTLLGLNKHRNVERDIFITDEDRLRHFYIIGQTGTGKTTLMKNMIVQDILRGDGVCMIDPHGTDIEDVLASIPSEREDDVIYFDPSNMERVVGLNMLEYDYSKPEQKTFVVNELFSIFQKLYGANPESMGPMFEQYFRNATMLVMEDPDSGNTLMDIGRVMTDDKYRRYKLERAKNPVVVQFWREIALKAGGEASLENIVPYIVSKFDVFTANDYMRPIIGQQHSSFDFRKVMDNKQILLVNLAKGRLGEINSNLIGMIVVGKILMAALSRVDDPSKSFAPFYLHMDEFQNISTDSISAILSEARKYKLGLTIAHQFIAQLQPDIKDAVFGNVGSMAAFRVGPEDAQYLESQFSPVFNQSDLMNVPNRNAFLRVLADGTPTPPFSIATNAPAPVDRNRVEELIAKSLAKHGRLRTEVEEEIRLRYQKPAPRVPPAPKMM